MSFFQKNSSPMLPNQPPRKQPEPKKATKQDKLLFWLVLGCSAVSTLIYFTLVELSKHMESLITAQVMGIGVMVFYAVAGAAFLFTYIIYNRGFTRDNITPEMLPDTMSEQQKAEFIQSGKDRKRKSKWMIIVIFALFLPLAVDFIVLVAVPTLLSSMLGQSAGS